MSGEIEEYGRTFCAPYQLFQFIDILDIAKTSLTEGVIACGGIHSLQISSS